MYIISRCCLLCTLLIFVMAACQPIVAPEPATAPVSDVQLAQETVAQIETLIEEKVNNGQIPGFAIGIVKQGKVVYAKGFGVAEVGTERKVTTESIFQLSSIGKTLVLLAILQLVEQGKVDLDLPITTYLPAFHMQDERYQQITIRHLLTHQAGLPDWSGEDNQNPQYEDTALERYASSFITATLAFAPGEQREYSSAGYDLLGAIIAKVSGLRFEDYIAQQIFTPLGMQHSTFLLQAADPALLVAPHTTDNTQKLVTTGFYPYTRQHAPSSALYSNIEDMTRYLLFALKHGELDGVRLIEERWYDELWTPLGEVTDWTLQVNPLNTHYGLGWNVTEVAGHRVINHAGGDLGFNAQVILVPDQGIGIVTMTNVLDFTVAYATDIAIATLHLMVDEAASTDR